VDQDYEILLKTSIFRGASLDVYHEEPLPKDHFFLNFDEITDGTPNHASVYDYQFCSTTNVEKLPNALQAGFASF